MAATPAAAIDPQIEASWKAVLADEFTQPYFTSLKQFLVDERAAGRTFYPPGSNIFRAFALTPFEAVRVVIVGQDPYHGAGQAHGLSFSVPEGVAQPPSLVNIMKEIETDVGIPRSTGGTLEHWAQQGVLLLNATLTVGAGVAGSHQGKGWEQFTDAVIRELNARREGLVFLLWGRYAQKKGASIDRERHHVLTAAHPSPFSAASGFFGCRHFSQTNAILRQQRQELIDWSVPVR